MTNVDIVTRYWDALAAADFERARELLAPDFGLYGLGPAAIDRDTFLAFQRAQRAAFPDFAFNQEVVRADGDVVRVRIRGTGTHLGVLEVPLPGVPRLAPTGRAFAMPPEEFELTVAGAVIARADAHLPPGGGYAAIVAQLTG